MRSKSAYGGIRTACPGESNYLYQKYRYLRLPTERVLRPGFLDTPILAPMPASKLSYSKGRILSVLIIDDDFG